MAFVTLTQKPYEYQHYPKWVKTDTGATIAVNDEYEHERDAPKDFAQDSYLEAYRKKLADEDAEAEIEPVVNQLLQTAASVKAPGSVSKAAPAVKTKSPAVKRN